MAPSPSPTAKPTRVWDEYNHCAADNQLLHNTAADKAATQTERDFLFHSCLTKKKAGLRPRKKFLMDFYKTSFHLVSRLHWVRYCSHLAALTAACPPEAKSPPRDTRAEGDRQCPQRKSNLFQYVEWKKKKKVPTKRSYKPPARTITHSALTLWSNIQRKQIKTLAIIR